MACYETSFLGFECSLHLQSRPLPQGRGFSFSTPCASLACTLHKLIQRIAISYSLDPLCITIKSLPVLVLASCASNLLKGSTFCERSGRAALLTLPVRHQKDGKERCNQSGQAVNVHVQSPGGWAVLLNGLIPLHILTNALQSWLKQPPSDVDVHHCRQHLPCIHLQVLQPSKRDGHQMMGVLNCPEGASEEAIRAQGKDMAASCGGVKEIIIKPSVHGRGFAIVTLANPGGGVSAPDAAPKRPADGFTWAVRPLREWAQILHGRSVC